MICLSVRKQKLKKIVNIYESITFILTDSKQSDNVLSIHIM